MKQLFTIGHSNQSQEEFLAMLRRHGINCVVDVRSVPASKYTPQFNMEQLRGFLKHNDVREDNSFSLWCRTNKEWYQERISYRSDVL